MVDHRTPCNSTRATEPSGRTTGLFSDFSVCSNGCLYSRGRCASSNSNPRRHPRTDELTVISTGQAHAELAGDPSSLRCDGHYLNGRQRPAIVARSTEKTCSSPGSVPSNRVVVGERLARSPALAALIEADRSAGVRTTRALAPHTVAPHSLHTSSGAGSGVGCGWLII